MRNALDKLSDDQVVALSAWIKGIGRYWRKRFAEEPNEDLPVDIQVIRAKFSAAIAHSLDTNAVHAEAKQVLEARGEH